MSKSSQKGFTLIELSIVIVIIGLIVAGVVAGQSLVKQAQLRSIITEQEQVRVALNSFKLEYNAIPGDFALGSSYWATGCNLAGTGASVAAECNGDGNKQILMATSVTATFLGESYVAWKQLSLAGLFSGSFVPGAAITGVIGTNIPASKYSGAGLTLLYDESTTIGATQGDGSGAGGANLGKNILLVGGAVASDIANGTIFTPGQVKGIDDKVDDGAPSNGTVVAVGVYADEAGSADACVTDGADDTNYNADDLYNLDSTNASPCALAFVL